MIQTIQLDKLQIPFSEKPLLVGGKAMEYYHLRKAGEDVDLIVSSQDYRALAKRFPGNTKDLYGDLGVIIYKFEIWQSICLFPYDLLARGGIEEDQVKIASLEKLLFLMAIAVNKPKYEQDLRLVSNKINNIQYGKDPDFKADYFLKS